MPSVTLTRISLLKRDCSNPARKATFSHQDWHSKPLTHLHPSTVRYLTTFGWSFLGLLWVFLRGRPEVVALVVWQGLKEIPKNQRHNPVKFNLPFRILFPHFAVVEIIEKYLFKPLTIKGKELHFFLHNGIVSIFCVSSAQDEVCLDFDDKRQ